MGSHPAPPQADHQPAADADAAAGDGGWPALAGRAFVVLSAVVEARRFERGAPLFAAVFTCHRLLLFLYVYCLTRFEGTPRGSPGRGRLRPPLSALAALLVLELAHQLSGAATATARPTPRAWEVAAAAATGAICALLQRNERNL